MEWFFGSLERRPRGPTGDAQECPYNLHQMGHIVQFEYEGVARVCWRRCRTGHHKAKCTVPQCVRCGLFGHDQCTLKCKHCGGNHGPSECKAQTYSSAAPPVASSTSQEQMSGVAEDREAH
ncbi:hypothetical protein HPB51_023550 [Rhipicephalus microplus]|uniref:Uncharacterized protein n=1 Tax=Rhipicephalus microplus TaxID=6941 RepID=A0A9J6E546_RHIMP|nr:hypothetical protein HPB51_023550 [Rhipicephalus microplus]